MLALIQTWKMDRLMGYEDDMVDWYDEQNMSDMPLHKGEILFSGKSSVSCVAVSFKTLIWNYFCWFLAGKPENWRTDGT